jgi:uncharacterized protein (TIGR02646 family)
VIRLRKGPEPQVLVENAATWTAEYLRLQAREDGVPAAAAVRYRHPEVKAAVKRDAHGKCIYCESEPLHVTPGDVEHLLPKSRFPELVVAWDNLAFVCPDCNRAKGDFHDETQAVVNPFREDPGQFLHFAGPMVFERAGSTRGIVTVRKLELDRAELVERRADHLRKIQSLLHTWALLPEGPARDEIASEIRVRAEDPGEYAATTRAFLQQSGFDVADSRPSNDDQDASLDVPAESAVRDDL